MSQIRQGGTTRRWLLAGVIVLLAGAALRIQSVSVMTDMVNLDEAHYGLDALSLLESPRLVPFFPANFGRESLWMYWLAAVLAVLQPTGFALRVAAVLAGFLILPGLYALVREIAGRSVAVWSTGALAVLYWHVHLSHVAWRVILFPTVGVLAWAVLWRAWRLNRMWLWAAAGVLMGLLAYTYFSARTWLVLAGLMLLWWIITDARRRRGALLSLLVTGGLCLPLVLYTLNNPAASTRAGQVLVTDVTVLIQNVLAWLPIWVIEGPLDEIHGYAGRPLLDVSLAVLAVAGVIRVLPALKTREQRVWLLLLAGASLAPAVLSDDATNLRRSFGLVVPLAVVIGSGAQAVVLVLRRLRLPTPVTVAIPAGLLLVSGVISGQDFAVWATGGRSYTLMEQYLYRMVTLVRQDAPEDVPVYFSPYADDHPVLDFLDWQLAADQHRTFQGAECLVLPQTDRALYASAVIYDVPLRDVLMPWTDDLRVWYAEPDSPTGEARYVIYEAKPAARLSEAWESAAVFDERLQMRLLTAIPETVQAGETIRVTVAMRRVAAETRPLTLFLHLYGDPTPYEGGRLWAQSDQAVCLSHPPVVWTDNEVIVQHVSLVIPAETAAGTYTLAAGLYETMSAGRLVVTEPVQVNDYVPVGTITVTGAE